MSVSLFGSPSKRDLDVFFNSEEKKNELSSPFQSPSKKIKTEFESLKAFPSLSPPASPCKPRSFKHLDLNPVAGTKRKNTLLIENQPAYKKAKPTTEFFSETDKVKKCINNGGLLKDYEENDVFIRPALPVRMPPSLNKVPPTPRKNISNAKLPGFPKAPPAPRKGYPKTNDDARQLEKDIEFQRCLAKYTQDPSCFLNEAPIGPPPTPCKRSNEKYIKDKKALEVAGKSSQALINDDNQLIEFKLGDFIARGSYSEVYEIASNSSKLYSTHENKELIFKRFQETMVLKIGNGIESCIHSMMQQYTLLKKLNFPVAHVLNNPKEDKFFIVERISQPFKINWNEATTEISSVDIAYLAQIKNMIAIALKHQIDLDLKPDNVGINANNEVILFDYREESEDDELAYVVSIKRAIELFSNGNKAVENYLRSTD